MISLTYCIDCKYERVDRSIKWNMHYCKGCNKKHMRRKLRDER